MSAQGNTTAPAPEAASARRPWLSLYPEGVPAELDQDHATMLETFAATLALNPTAPAVRYFDGTLTFKDLDDRSDALAVALAARGLGRGDRLALYLQNDPAYVVGLLAAWKLGGIAVAINPMNKARELTALLVDAGACALLCLDELWEAVARDVVASGETAVTTVVTCSARDDQTRDDERLFTGAPTPPPDDTLDLATLLAEYAGQAPPPVELGGGDVAVLTYTSGTTGVPKGAMNTHGNIAFAAQVYRDLIGLGPDDAVLGVAPLFHITGLVGHIGVTMLTGGALVLAHRFEPNIVLDAIREHRPAYTIGSITVFIALGGLPASNREAWSSFRVISSGGAPVAPAVVERFRARTGHTILPGYGLTETTSPAIFVFPGMQAPVDPASGSLSIGLPVPSTTARVVGEDGRELPPGEVGEVAVRGPQVVPGYWNRPDATAESLPDGELRTGDVGFMDPAGWFHLVDRKKDMINAAGYKVWPREVEDVFYGHEAVREVAVVGMPDEYRGESVRAYVSLEPGATITPDELVAWGKERMAAYKYPRTIEIVDDLPKTTTGKILRRELRAAAG